MYLNFTVEQSGACALCPGSCCSCPTIEQELTLSGDYRILCDVIYTCLDNENSTQWRNSLPFFSAPLVRVILSTGTTAFIGPRFPTSCFRFGFNLAPFSALSSIRFSDGRITAFGTALLNFLSTDWNKIKTSRLMSAYECLVCFILILYERGWIDYTSLSLRLDIFKHTGMQWTSGQLFFKN